MTIPTCKQFLLEARSAKKNNKILLCLFVQERKDMTRGETHHIPPFGAGTTSTSTYQKPHPKPVVDVFSREIPLTREDTDAGLPATRLACKQGGNNGIPTRETRTALLQYLSSRARVMMETTVDGLAIHSAGGSDQTCAQSTHTHAHTRSCISRAASLVGGFPFFPWAPVSDMYCGGVRPGSLERIGGGV